MKHSMQAAFGAVAVIISAAAVQAVPLVPGAFLPLPGQPQPAGVIVEDVTRNLSGFFDVTGPEVIPYEVTVRDVVVLAVDNTYDFYYTVTLVEKPDVYPLGVTRDGFTGYTTNVDYVSDDAGTLTPTDAARTADGDSITFSFGFNQPEGQTTHALFVDTNATTYSLNSTGAVDLSPSFNVNARPTFATFGPGLVPEPTSLVGVAVAAVALGLRRRR